MPVGWAPPHIFMFLPFIYYILCNAFWCPRLYFTCCWREWQNSHQIECFSIAPCDFGTGQDSNQQYHMQRCTKQKKNTSKTLTNEPSKNVYKCSWHMLWSPCILLWTFSPINMYGIAAFGFCMVGEGGESEPLSESLYIVGFHCWHWQWSFIKLDGNSSGQPCLGLLLWLTACNSNLASSELPNLTLYYRK